VNSERAAWITAVIVLLIAGLLIGRQFMGMPGGAPAAQRSDPIRGTSTEDLFRQWFWESRGLDLVAQMGLIFAGALGIATLLPQGTDSADRCGRRHPREEEI
jgi:hypothetical protein